MHQFRSLHHTLNTMVCKFIVLCAALAVTNAGHLVAPVAQVAHYSSAPAVSSSYISQPLAAIHGAPYAAPYAAVHAAPYAVQAAPVAAAPVAIHSPAIGASHQSVLRSLGGNQAVSTYSKAVDSAFSTVRKYDTRITNDALSVAHSPLYAQAAPVLAHSAPAAYATYAAPALAHAAPVATYSAPAPVATYAAHAPVATYAAHAPVATYAAHAPVATYAAHAPVTGYAASAPVLTKAAVSYSPATVVAHTTFTGLGAQYEW